MVAHRVGIRIIEGVIKGGRVNRQRGIRVGKVRGVVIQWVGVGVVGVGWGPPPGAGAQRNAHLLQWDLGMEKGILLGQAEAPKATPISWFSIPSWFRG